MAVRTKTWSTPRSIQNRLFWLGQWQNVGAPRRWTDTESATAEFSRPYPRNGLPPTGMVITRRIRNGSNYSTSERSGSIDFVFPGQAAIRTVKTSTGKPASIAIIDAKARLARGSLNLAQSLAESKETYGTIVTNINRIGRFALALKRGDIPSAARIIGFTPSRRARARLRNQSISDRLANGWLEFSYGIMPIVGDIEGAVEHLDSKFHAGASRTAFAGLTKRQASEIQDTDAADKWSASDHTVTVPPRVIYHGTIDNPDLRRAQELGFLNLSSLAWEILPLSFVFDWFGTIGAWLDSLTHGAGLRGIWGCQVTFSSTTTYVPGAGFYIKNESVTRSVIPPAFGSPFLLRNSPLRGSQITSLAALWKQRL